MAECFFRLTPMMAMTVMASTRRARNPNWLVERSAANALIVLLVLLGLLSVPTSCTCGATVAHAHSLFLILYHHHRHDGQELDTDAGQHADQQPTPVSFDLGDEELTIHEASHAGIHQTPTLIVNGTVITDPGYDSLKAAIDAALKKG